jgi:hypothetical protein
MDKLGGDATAQKDLEAAGRPKRSQRRHLLHNVFDVLAIAASTSMTGENIYHLSLSLARFLTACLIFGLLYLLVKPFRRGFFCDDTSIQYPYQHDTVPMWLLGVYGGLGPVIIVSIEKPDTSCVKQIDGDDVYSCSRLVCHRGDLGRSSVRLWPSRKPTQCERPTNRLHQNPPSNRISIRSGHCHLFSHY